MSQLATILTAAAKLKQVAEQAMREFFHQCCYIHDHHDDHDDLDDHDDHDDKVEDEDYAGDFSFFIRVIFRGSSLGGCFIRGGRTKASFS